MDRERLDKGCEWGMLGLVLAILVIGPLATGAVRQQDFLVLQAMTVAVALLWVVRLWVSPRAKLLFPPICWAVLAFAGYAIVRYFTSTLEYPARQELIRLLVYTFLFFAVLNNLHRQEIVQAMMFTLVFLGMFIASYAVFQFATKSDRVWNFITPYRGRGCGTYICPNHLAGFLEMILPLGLAYVVTGRLHILTKIFLAYATVVIAAGIAVSLSRGGWIATAGSLLVFVSLLFFQRKYRLQMLFLVGLFVWAALFFVPKIQDIKSRIEGTFGQATSLNDARFELWKPAMKIWKENLWFGAGPAHFDYRFREYRPEDLQLQPDRAHNDVLNTFVDWGIAGAGLVLSAWVLLVLGASRTWPHLQGVKDLARKPSNKLAVVLGGCVGLFAILLHSAFDFNFHIPANAIVAVVLMAVVTSHLRFASDRWWVSLGGAGRAACAAVLMGGAVFLSAQGGRSARDFAWTSHAETLPRYSDEQIAALEKAYASEPMNFATTYALGEALRIQSWKGDWGYEELARRAMDWYELSIRLNPYDAYSYMRYGMCLHQLGRHEEARLYFDRAAQLDPNGYYLVAHVGWHFVQLGDFTAARPWLERSLRLSKSQENEIAATYLEIVNRRLMEAAAQPQP